MAGLRDFAYPFLQLDRSQPAIYTVFHDLIVQVLLLNLCLATMVLAMDKQEGGVLTALKVAQVASTIGVVVFTVTSLSVHDGKGGTLQRLVSLISAALAVVSVVLGAVVLAYGGRGGGWWIEVIVVLVGVFWAWRSGVQNVVARR